MADNVEPDKQDGKVEKRTKSIVWNYFTKENSDKEARCHVCRDTLAYKGTITNLLEHPRLDGE
jgi:hypothetical protein